MTTPIETIIKKLLIKEPFYGIFLLGMNKHFGNECSTACVYKDGINCALSINEEFWNSLESDDMRVAVLKHELSHILFKHIFASQYYGDPDHFNVAADAEVNSYIPLLQNDPYVYPAKFNLDNELGTKYYYNNIPTDNEYEQPDDGSGSGGKPNHVDDHSSWSGFEGISEAEKDIIDHQIDYMAKETAEQVSKMAGSIPGQFKGYIDSLFVQKPQIFNWKAYFRRLIGTIRSEEIRKTRRKESKRFAGAAGLKKDKKTEILVAIDTSGSVSNKELCDFFSEINNVYKSGAVVKIIEFDHALQRVYDYSGKWDGSISGRGGTSFEIPIDYYNEHRRDYQTMIVFTDGYANIENLNPQGPVIWVITSEGSRQNYPGKTIYIPRNE